MKNIEELELIEDEILSIEECDIIDTIDIEVDSENRLFFANDILTHNSGWESSDLNITNIAESAALLHTVDVLFGIITNAEMKARGEYFFKCLANRVSGYENTKKRYTIDWKYARIEEDKSSPIQDMDFLINTTTAGHRHQFPRGGGSIGMHAFVSQNMQPEVPTETDNSGIKITGTGLF